MNRRHMKITPFLVLPLLAFHCGLGYPVVLNTLDRPILLSVAYRNGQSYSGEIAAGAKVWAPANAVAIDEIEIRSQGKLLFRLRKDELEHMSSDITQGGHVIWEVHEDGVRAVLAPS